MDGVFHNFSECSEYRLGAALACGVAGFCFGSFNELLVSLAALAALDFVFGFCRAWHGRCISSTKIREGLRKFILYGVAIFVAYRLDVSIVAGMHFYLPFALRDATAAYLILGEAISICEHLHCCGCPLPTFLVNRLRVARLLLSECEPESGAK